MGRGPACSLSTEGPRPSFTYSQAGNLPRRRAAGSLPARRCRLPSPDAGRGLGAGRSPQGNICTFQTRVVSGGGACQARHPHPGAGCSAGNKLGGRLRGAARRGYVTARQSQPPPSARTGQRREEARSPPGPSRPALSSLGRKRAPLSPARGTPPDMPPPRASPGWGRRGRGLAARASAVPSPQSAFTPSIYGKRGRLPGPEMMMFKLTNSSPAERANLKKNTPSVLEGGGQGQGSGYAHPTSPTRERPGQQRPSIVHTGPSEEGGRGPMPRMPARGARGLGSQAQRPSP